MTDRIDAIIGLLKDKYIITVKENQWKDSHMFEHEDGTYKCVDWGDRDNPIKIDTKAALDDDKCKFVLKCQLRPDSHEKLRPFFFFAKSGNKLDDQLPQLRAMSKSREKLYWRGSFHLEREATLNETSQCLNADYQQTRDQNVYYRQMAQSKLALSLPGLGPACHREFEAFAVGTPVIMPYFKNIYYEGISPNYEYICIDQRTNETLGESVVRRYHEVKEDKKLLSFIAKNAMEYYDEYCSVESSSRWMVKLLEL